MKYAHLLFLLTFFLASCGEEEATQTEEILRPVRYGKVVKTGTDEDQVFSGTAQSAKESKLSFKVAGTINKIFVKVGDRVKTGQLIAALDAIDYSVSFDQAVAQQKSAETQIKSAKAQLVSSKSTYERIEKLYENGSIPLSEFEQAKTGYDAAESQHEAAIAQYDAAQKQVEAARNQVSYARLTAPFSGIITMVNVEENELVNSGSPIAILNAEGKPEVRVGIPEIFISGIQKGQEVDISFSILPNQAYKGVVSEVGFSSGQGATYPVIVQITKPGNEIRPGMAANVKFHFHEDSHEKQYLVTPVKSVGEGVDGNFVFLLKKDSSAYIAQKQTVEIGELLMSGFEIKNGLKEGDLVATAGLKSLLDGMKVSLME